MSPGAQDDIREQMVTDHSGDRVIGPLKSGLVVPVARYSFAFEMLDVLLAPAYAGSLLRGQFGAALRRTACMTGMETCHGCLLRTTCPYTTLFEAPAPPNHRLQHFSDVPNPYVIEPDVSRDREYRPGDVFGFSIVLVGGAVDHLPLVIFSFERAFAKGIGRQRSRGKLQSVIHEGPAHSTIVWEPGVSAVGDHAPTIEIPHFNDSEEVTITLETPLRLQANGQPLRPGQITPRKLVTTLLRRTTLLLETHVTLNGVDEQARILADLAAHVSDSQQLRWFDWTRYSSRQDREMTLGGVLGQWTLRGRLTPLLSLLWLGQWLHVGKNATMGMGRYVLEVSSPTP